jgi:hypothetical protein
MLNFAESSTRKCGRQRVQDIVVHEDYYIVNQVMFDVFIFHIYKILKLNDDR